MGGHYRNGVNYGGVNKSSDIAYKNSNVEAALDLLSTNVSTLSETKADKYNGEINTNVNADSLVETAKYKINAYDYSLVNFPYRFGILKVTNANGFIEQTMITADGRELFRVKDNSNSWTEWKQVTTNTELYKLISPSSIGGADQISNIGIAYFNDRYTLRVITPNRTLYFYPDVQI